MQEVHEVHHYDEPASTNTSAVAIFVIAVLALLGIGLLAWQPWNAPATRDTTIIHDSNPAVVNPAPTVVNPAPTVVTPPASNTVVTPPASHTDVHINQAPPASSGDTNTGSSTENTGTTGSQ